MKSLFLVFLILAALAPSAVEAKPCMDKSECSPGQKCYVYCWEFLCRGVCDKPSRRYRRHTLNGETYFG